MSAQSMPIMRTLGASWKVSMEMISFLMVPDTRELHDDISTMWQDYMAIGRHNEKTYPASTAPVNSMTAPIVMA